MADVLILGAGVIGCAVAEALTRRGARVRILDPRGVGLGASQASAGMLAPFTEGRHDPVMQALGARSLDRYDGLIDRLRADGHEVSYSRQGSIDVVFDEAGARRLADDSRALTADAIAHTVHAADAARELAPAINDAVQAVLEIPTHGAVSVSELTSALWHSAEQRGARITAATATRLTRAQGTLCIETSLGRMDAPHVVLGAGCWAGRIDIAGAPPLPIRPVRGQLLALRLPSPPISQAVWGPDCYLVPWRDGTVLVGATVEEVGFDERATAAGVRSLLSAAPCVLPALANAEFAAVRVGLRPGTPDDRPVLGPSVRVPGLIYAAGHYRNGALLAPITGEIVADLVEGRAVDPALAPFSPGRFGEY